MVVTSAELDPGTSKLLVSFSEDITSDPAGALTWTAYTSVNKWVQDTGVDPVITASNVLEVTMLLDSLSVQPLHLEYANTDVRVEGDPGNLLADNAAIPLTIAP